LSKQEKQAAILKIKDEVLTDLFKAKPSTRQMINSAAGYAVFDNGNVNLFFFSVGGGIGVVKNMKTSKYTYMKMAEAGVGLGLGIKDFRAVMVFHSQDVLKRFIEDGWQFGGHADAAAKAGDKGAAIAGEMVVDNITIFQMTESGLALQAQLKGTKFWKDDELN
ncbi:MAG: YSC84-related protein, partial [Kangiellaceae bacterium]|nr:YSC84-related protein [Kangiellaceae bacterium]